MSHALEGLYTYAEFGAVLLAIMPMMGLSHLRHRGDPTQRMPGRWMRRIGKTASALTPLWNFSIEGTAPADIATKAYVVVSNHESTADPFLLSWLPWDMRWVSKEELFKVPVIGWAMKFGGDIPLRRGDGDSVRNMFAECRRALDGGISVMLFPEGTRSKDGNLLPFKDGAFDLAIAAGVPILPIALSGTRDCRPKGSKWFGRAKAAARILDPIPTAGMTKDDVAKLRDLTRSRIVDALPALRKTTGMGSKTEGSVRRDEVVEPRRAESAPPAP